MRRSLLLLAAAGISVATVTGSAFSAENTIDDTVSGYGESAITGAVVTEIDLVPLAADSTYLDQVLFTTTTQLDTTPSTGHTAVLTLKDGGSPMAGTPLDCSIGAWSGSAHVITCNTADTTPFNLIDSVGLTVRD